MNKFRKPHGGGGGGNRGFGDRGGRPSFGGSRPSFGGSRDGGGEKFDAICATCGNKCQVPFRPNGKKPVYCSNCFGAQRGESAPGQNSFPKRDFSPRPSFESRPEQSFAPRESHAPRQDDRAIADLKREVSAMAGKLDSILRILEQSNRAPAVAASAPKQIATPTQAKGPAPELPMILTKLAAKIVAKKEIPAKAKAKKIAKKK